MSERHLPDGSPGFWVRGVTDELSVELWPEDSAHIRLVSSSYPIKVSRADLPALVKALQDVIEELEETADQVLNYTGPVIDLTRDHTGVVIDQVPDHTEPVIDLSSPVIGGQDEALECDICGQQAIVVIDDDEHTTLCDDCYDGYFREQPAWTVEEYLKRQKDWQEIGGDAHQDGEG